MQAISIINERPLTINQKPTLRAINIDQYPEKIGLVLSGEIRIFAIKEILYCQAESNYTTIYLTNKRSVLVSKTLKKVQQSLPPSKFIRVHNSFLINADEICSISHHIKLSNAVKIPISRSKKDMVMERMEAFVQFI